MSYVIALDEGTTSCRACLYDTNQNKIIKIKSREISQFYPKPSYVEQDANEIFLSQYQTLKEVLFGIDVSDVLGVSITNQRETVVLFDKYTFEPVYNAIVWQCRRTIKFCEEISEKYGEIIEDKTGLKVDAYFSASKIKWILENVPKAKKLLSENRLLAGTIDTYLIYRLTNGKSFVTDVTNASRTLLFNIKTLDYDNELLKIFSVPREILPKVVSCDEIVGSIKINGKDLPICGICGDQQSALVGQLCFEEGESKITYGTGMFLLENVGANIPKSKNGLLTTIAYKINGQVRYAMEGSVFNAGSVIKWLRDELRMIKTAEETEEIAESIEDTLGVFVVPALTGLGAPYWVGDAKGIITGLTRGTNYKHIVRAVLESLCYSAKDLIDCMNKDSGINVKTIKVDGGASRNNFLMQFQSDVLQIEVDRPMERESTALGAIYLCLLGLKYYSVEELKKNREVDRIFSPKQNELDMAKKYEGYQAAVKQCLSAKRLG